MSELERILKEISKMPGVKFKYYAENTRPTDIPICDRQFERVTDDGNYTYFRFLYHGVGYVGVLEGVGEVQTNYALLLPSYIEGFDDKDAELSKTEHFLGEEQQYLLQVGERYILVYIQGFYLVEEGVRTVADGFVTIYTARANDADRRLGVFHHTALYR